MGWVCWLVPPVQSRLQVLLGLQAVTTVFQSQTIFLNLTFLHKNTMQYHS